MVDDRFPPRIPGSTYRIQFSHRFKFSDAREIIPYLHELGITDLYASPFFKAHKESLHGYDLVDHNALNPELGPAKKFDQLIAEMRKHGMGLILDIVPNHMDIEDPDNAWWMDVLENGPSACHAEFFDINWKPVKKELEDKVLLPILGDQYGTVLERQELNLRFEEGAFFVYYYDHKLPVLPKTYIDIVSPRLENLKTLLSPEHPPLVELLSIITALNYLPAYTEKDREKILERYREKEIVKKRLLALYQESPQIRRFIDENVAIFNGTKGDPKSFNLLDDLLGKQVWRLSYWRVATEEINYRRFFDINSLAAIRVENPRVFEETHRLVFKLIREGKADGLRVDHPDGLYNLPEYFTRLQEGCFVQTQLAHGETSRQGVSPHEDDLDPQRLSEILAQYRERLSADPQFKPFYIVGEKILSKGEKMPEDWPVHSTIGYVFLSPVNGIFVDTRNAKAFDDIYARFTRSRTNYPDLVYEKKKLIMQTSVASEINTLAHYLDRISEKDRHTRDFTLNSLRTAITEVMASFPVYRTYVTHPGANERDRRYIEQALSRAKRKNPALSATIFDFLGKVLLLDYREASEESEKREWLEFVMRFQQTTGPVMAKGVEDTVFYVYNRLVSLNEVGGTPERFGTPLETFHGQNIERTKFWRYGLNTTSTHDTKRSEDVRARINVLSEIPVEWRQALVRWSRANKGRKPIVDGQRVPDRNEEYLLYQSLLGAWPNYPMGEKEIDAFRKRIKDYMLKAVREAKVNTSWISPNLPYEEGLLKFIDDVLSSTHPSAFIKDFENFQRKISYFGMFNSLSQTLIKITSPGAPDFYQGTELWDFSLVDPDNRRPVNFDLRRKMLKALKRKFAVHGPDLAGSARELLEEWQDGSIKLYVTFKSLNYRRENHELFKEGDYTPLVGEGNFKDHVCSFSRQREGKTVSVIVPRFLTRLIQDTEERPLGTRVWGNTGVIVPGSVGKRFFNLFTGETIEAVGEDGKAVLPLPEVFANFPVALLESDSDPGPLEETGQSEQTIAGVHANMVQPQTGRPGGVQSFLGRIREFVEPRFPS